MQTLSSLIIYFLEPYFVFSPHIRLHFLYSQYHHLLEKRLIDHENNCRFNFLQCAKYQSATLKTYFCENLKKKKGSLASSTTYIRCNAEE